MTNSITTAVEDVFQAWDSNFTLELDGVAGLCHETSVSKGFWDDKDPKDIDVQLSKIALIHSEASEVLEALRKEKGSQQIVEELADILVRTLDLWAALESAGVVTESLGEELGKKMLKNLGRPHMHGVLA